MVQVKPLGVVGARRDSADELKWSDEHKCCWGGGEMSALTRGNAGGVLGRKSDSDL